MQWTLVIYVILLWGRMRNIYRIDIITNKCNNPFIADFIFGMFINSPKIYPIHNIFIITILVVFCTGNIKVIIVCIINIFVKTNSFKHCMEIPWPPTISVIFEVILMRFTNTANRPHQTDNTPFTYVLLIVTVWFWYIRRGAAILINMHHVQTVSSNDFRDMSGKPFNGIVTIFEEPDILFLSGGHVCGSFKIAFFQICVTKLARFIFFRSTDWHGGRLLESVPFIFFLWLRLISDTAYCAVSDVPCCIS